MTDHKQMRAFKSYGLKALKMVDSATKISDNTINEAIGFGGFVGILLAGMIVYKKVNKIKVLW
jgi:hypothetical protein